MSKMVEPMKTGELLVKEGLIGLNDIDQVLSIQEKRETSLGLKKSRLFGMILCDLNLITPMDNYCVLYKYNRVMSIQSALVSKQILSQQGVSESEKESIRLQIPFISVLLKNKRISISSMQRLLFDLFHIPFRSIGDFIFVEKDRKHLLEVLDQRASLENRIIPLVLKGNTILFGITDPENLVFLRQLNDRFPQYRFKTVFIPFSGFSWFHKMIYGGKKTISPSRETPQDISLLFSFKTTITDPEAQPESILTLYHRYEQLRQLMGNPMRESQQNAFAAFIIQQYQRITQEYGSHSIEFSLKQEGADVKVAAFPKT